MNNKREIQIAQPTTGEEEWQAVKDSSVSFWLDINNNALIKRLRSSKKRPLLLKKNLNTTVKKIYKERKNTYNKANFRVKCDNLKPEIISNKIIKLYENSSN